MPKLFREQQVTAQICYEASCDVCGTKLEPSISTESQGNVGFSGALEINCESGAYGEYLDGEPPTKGILCSKCATNFMERYPFMRPAR